VGGPTSLSSLVIKGTVILLRGRGLGTGPLTYEGQAVTSWQYQGIQPVPRYFKFISFINKIRVNTGSVLRKTHFTLRDRSYQP
jgi:hypothetical protein